MIPVSIVVLSHNRLGEISKNLPRLLSERHHPDGFEIIVVDNNSTDGSREFLIAFRKEYPEIKLILNESNLGVAGGRNAGFAVAQREFVVALDDDTAIEAEDLRRVPSLFEKYPDAGVLAFRVIHPLSGEAQNPHGDVPCEVANYHGAAHAFRRSAIESIGLLDEECFYGGEELDSCIWLHDIGYLCLYVPDVVAIHNSILRDRQTEVERVLWWVFNYARVLFKYLPLDMARLYCHRLLVSQILNGIRRLGAAESLNIIYADRNGRAAGLQVHRCVRKETVVYYSDENLRPDFGNVPLWRKAQNRLRRRI